MVPKSIIIGPITIHFYGLIIAAAIFLAISLAKKRAVLYKVDPAIFDNHLILIPLLMTLIGARAYHVIDYWNVYSQNPALIFNISNGGLGIIGGLIGFFLGFFIIAKINKINFLSLLDLISAPLLLAQALGRIGNFINQEAFGPPTSLPWGIYISPQNRPENYQSFSYFHPTFFYEMILDIIFVWILLWLSKRFKLPGKIFAFYLIFYSVSRFIVEFFRIDTWIVGEIKIAQIFTLLFILIGLILLFSKNSTLTGISTHGMLSAKTKAKR